MYCYSIKSKLLFDYGGVSFKAIKHKENAFPMYIYSKSFKIDRNFYGTITKDKNHKITMRTYAF